MGRMKSTQLGNFQPIILRIFQSVLTVPEWAARMMANSRRGPWEMSRNTNNALPTSYREAKGLKSLLSRYLELC
ncbi:MAG: hypothetical protein C6W55_00215 [Thermobacillus sp.]|nr:MAG: hypothetical protein C6W55_00215 [Thermobacillus sp.]